MQYWGMTLRTATRRRTTQLETQQVLSKLNAMSSFKAVQEMLFFCLEEEIIVFFFEQGLKADATEDLCILLKRFAYPCRYSDMIPIFARSVPELNIISNEITDWLYTNHGHRVTHRNHRILSPAMLDVYATAICNKSRP